MSAALVYRQLGMVENPTPYTPIKPGKKSRDKRKKNSKENIRPNERAVLQEEGKVHYVCGAANQRATSTPRDTTSTSHVTSTSSHACSTLNSGKIREEHQASQNSSVLCSSSSVCSVESTKDHGVHLPESEPNSSSPPSSTEPSKKCKRRFEDTTDKKDTEKTHKRVCKTKVKVVDQGVVTLDMIERRKSKDGDIDGRKEARELFEWMIYPVTTEQFFKDLWEKKPLLVKRHNTSYNESWFSTEEFSRILEQNPIQFGTHLDLTSYRENMRQTHNQPGRAYPKMVWKHFKNGGSIRMLNPQTYSNNVWKYLSTLQDFFGSTMGANVYLTPDGTQGFAPHWDDIEAFLVQLEGKKRWRLYSPKSDAEALPRYSSHNLSQGNLGKPILDVVLEAGDLLYFPRGTIHQGQCLPDSHSLHITVSTYQKNSWCDLMEKLLPKALQVAAEEDKEYREGLPLDYLNFMGVSKSDIINSKRSEFLLQVKDLTERLVRYAPIDLAVDDLAGRFLHESMPPHPERGSIARFSTEARCTNSGQANVSRSKVTATSRVRLTTPFCARVVAHESCVSLQHACSNTRIIHEVEAQEIDYTNDHGPALELLTNSYPKFVEVRSLPLVEEDALELVQELVDMDILQVHPKDSAKIASLLRSKLSKRNSANKVATRRNGGIAKERPFSGEWEIVSRQDHVMKLPEERKFRTLERDPHLPPSTAAPKKKQTEI